MSQIKSMSDCGVPKWGNALGFYINIFFMPAFALFSAALWPLDAMPACPEPSPANLESELIFEPLSQNTYPVCFSKGKINNIKLQVFNFKKLRGVKNANEFTRLSAYVFSPQEKSPENSTKKLRPAIALFHGGAWRSETPERWFPGARIFSSLGYVSVSFAYRLTSDSVSTPLDSVADAQSALRWLRKNSLALGIDPKQIAAIGDSAGGHLALATALAPEFDNAAPQDKKFSRLPNAVVALYPVLDTSIPEIACPSISPLALLEKQPLPPTLILQGDADSSAWTPVGKAQEFLEKSNRRESSHKPVELRIFPGRDHDFLIHSAEAFAQTIEFTELFLRGHNFRESESLPPDIQTSLCFPVPTK